MVEAAEAEGVVAMEGEVKKAAMASVVATLTVAETTEEIMDVAVVVVVTVAVAVEEILDAAAVVAMVAAETVEEIVEAAAAAVATSAPTGEVEVVAGAALLQLVNIARAVDAVYSASAVADNHIVGATLLCDTALTP